MRYPGPQLRLLILLALTLLTGLGVREWRAGFPDAAQRLERFDREEDAAILPEPAPARATPAASSAPRVAAPVGPAAPSRPHEPGRPAPPGLAPAPIPAFEPIDVNRADASALARLPGVSPALAQRIVEERERRGRFDSPEALRYVLGMGPKKLAAIRPFVTVRD
ncbi:MAG TPA: helix-hairpin-helix domain-containing protein [Methylomirabilota bacterium]|nr:helix-hairpin-helix domain-containing protein [Methylomirabilota bacterium]